MGDIPQKITDHEGAKYLREIHPAVGGQPILIDVYEVIKAYKVECPAVQHAVKKLLAAGQRDKGSYLADLIGAQAAISRAINFAKRESDDERHSKSN